MSTPPRSLSLLIAGVIFLLDRLTKIWVEGNISAFSSHPVIPGFFDLVHTKNRGAAFGMFSDAESPWRTFLLIGVSLAVLIFIAVLLLRPGRGGFTATWMTLIGLSLVLGGALGNIYDRIVHGMVTDFLEFYYGQYRFAAFNVADSAITTGAFLLLLDMWKTRNHADVAQTH